MDRDATYGCIALRIQKGCSGIKDRNQRNSRPIYHHLAFIGKIHSDLGCNIALNLSDAPFCVLGMTYQHAGGQNGVQIFHDGAFTIS